MIRRTEYELMLIAHPDLNRDEGVPALVAKVQGWIEGVDGEVTYSDIWGRRRLAYQVLKHREGTYVLMRAIIPRESILELERELKLEEEIIRYLITRAETPLPPRPQPRPRPVPAEERQAPPAETAPEPEAVPEPDALEESGPTVPAEDEPQGTLEAETAAEVVEDGATEAEGEPEAGTASGDEEADADAAEDEAEPEAEAEEGVDES
jgi:small subunit ribosomal protein S6